MSSRNWPSRKRVTMNTHPTLSSVLSKYPSNRGAWRMEQELQVRALHYGQAEVQPELNELLQGNRKSIK